MQSSIPWSSKKYTGCPGCKTLRPNGVEHSTVVTFLIKTACATPRHMEPKTCCSWRFPEPMHALETECISAWRHFNTFKPGTRKWWASSGGNQPNTQKVAREKITFHTKAYTGMAGKQEEVFHYLEERTGKGLVIKACWNLEMQQVVMAFLLWRLPSMDLTFPHKKIHAAPADSRPSNQYALQTHWKPPNRISSQTHLIFKN